MNVFFVGCGGDDAPNTPAPNEEPGPSTGSTCPEEQTLTHENFGMAFFEMYCTGCHSESLEGGDRHGAPRGLNWDNLDTVRLHAREIDRMAAAGPNRTNRLMPPVDDPVPSDEERRDLGEWLACDAP